MEFLKSFDLKKIFLSAPLLFLIMAVPVFAFSPLPSNDGIQKFLNDYPESSYAVFTVTWNNGAGSTEKQWYAVPAGTDISDWYMDTETRYLSREDTSYPVVYLHGGSRDWVFTSPVGEKKVYYQMYDVLIQNDREFTLVQGSLRGIDVANGSDTGSDTDTDTGGSSSGEGIILEGGMFQTILDQITTLLGGALLPIALIIFATLLGVGLIPRLIRFFFR